MLYFTLSIQLLRNTVEVILSFCELRSFCMLPRGTVDIKTRS
jgi:hypothetical protein